MESNDDESNTLEDDKYHIVILHSDSQTRLAEATCESIQKIDLGNLTFSLEIRTLESIGSPGRTMVDILNHVFEKSTFVMFPRCSEFFQDSLNKFAVSACLEDRIQHTDPRRHWTFIPLDIEKKVKIKGHPIVNSLTGVTISSSGALGEGQERKVRELFQSKLDIPRETRRSDEARVKVKEAIVQNKTRQVQDICKLVLSADCPATEQQQSRHSHTCDGTDPRSTRQMPGNRESSDTSIAEVSGHTASQGRRRADAESSSSPRRERLSQDFLTAQAVDENLEPHLCPLPTETLHKSNLTSRASRGNPEPTHHDSSPQGETLHLSSPTIAGEGRTIQESHLPHTTTVYGENRRPETINTLPSVPSSHSRWDTATSRASHQQFSSSNLPQSVELDNLQSVYFCVPRLMQPTPSRNASFYNIANATAQQGFVYGHTPQQYTTHFQNPICPQAVPILQEQAQWQYPNGTPREYWNRLGARPKTGNTAYCDPSELHTNSSIQCKSISCDTGQEGFQPGDQSFLAAGLEAATRRCVSAPVEGQVRRGDFVPGQKNTSSCTVFLERGPAKADRRRHKDGGCDGGEANIGGARVRDTVQGQNQTSAQSPSNLLPHSTPGLEAHEGKSHTYAASQTPVAGEKDTENKVSNHDSTAEERPCGQEELASGFNPTQQDRKKEENNSQERETSTKSTKYQSSTGKKELKRHSDKHDTERGTRSSRQTQYIPQNSRNAQAVLSSENQNAEKGETAMARAFPSLNDCSMTNVLEPKRNINLQPTRGEPALPAQPPLKVPPEMSHKVPFGSEGKQEYCERSSRECSSRELHLQTRDTVHSASPDISAHDAALLGSFPELEEVVSQMSECSLTPPTSRKFGHNHLTFYHLEEDCAPTRHSDQGNMAGSACNYRHPQHQGQPSQHCPSPNEVDTLHLRQLQQPPCQHHWQQELPQLQLLEQHQRPQMQNRQAHRQNREGLAELNAAGRSLNQARSSTDTDSGRGTI